MQRHIGESQASAEGDGGCYQVQTAKLLLFTSKLQVLGKQQAVNKMVKRGSLSDLVIHQVFVQSKLTGFFPVPLARPSKAVKESDI